MNRQMTCGTSSISFQNPVFVQSCASVVSRKEGEGPLGAYFDTICEDPMFGTDTWEAAESTLQKQAALLAIKKNGLTCSDIQLLFAGDLLAQTSASSFGTADLKIPFYGLFGACSTMGESLSLGSMCIDGGYGKYILCATSSHFASAEKEFRFPLGYGNQRPLSATWTVTGAGACILGYEPPPRPDNKTLNTLRNRNICGGVGSKGTETRDADFVEHIYPATMHNTMMFFTQKGKCYWLKVYEIPEGTKNSKGRAIQNLLNIDSDDAVNAYLRVKNLNDQEFINSHYVLFCTKNGVIKKTLLEQYTRPRQNGVNAITIREDDRVIEVRMTNGDNEIIIANRNGRAIRFHESAVRVMGRTATGVRGMTLDEDGQDEVVGMICIKDPEAETIMVVSEQGYGKRSDIEDYRKTNRGGKGVKTMNITDKTGKLVTIKSVTDENDLMIINKSGITIRLKVADVRIMGRATQGVRLINLEKRNDEVGSVCKVTSENEEELIEEGEENTLESPQNEVNNENEE